MFIYYIYMCVCVCRCIIESLYAYLKLIQHSKLTMLQLKEKKYSEYTLEMWMVSHLVLNFYPQDNHLGEKLT